MIVKVFFYKLDSKLYAASEDDQNDKSDLAHIPKFTDLRLDVVNQSSGDQEFVEDFLLSNRDLRDSYVEAKKKDENLTAEQFIRQAGASVVRQLKRHELNSQRKNVITNFFLSDAKLRQAYDEQKKKNPKLSEEDFIRANEDILHKYQDFVRKQDKDKVIDRYLKQNRDVEDMFLDYQDQYGDVEFEDFLRVAPPAVREGYANYARHEETVKELHKVLEEHPELKKVFLQTKSEHRHLNDVDLFAKEGLLREEFEKVKAKRFHEEGVFYSFLADSPVLKAEYEKFRSLNVNSGIKDFLDSNPDIQTQLRLYSKVESKNKTIFDKLLVSDEVTSKAFSQFVQDAKVNSKFLARMVQEQPKQKEMFENFLRNSEKSSVNYEKFVRSNPTLIKQFEQERVKNKNLTYKKFVEGSRQVGVQYSNFLHEQIQQDSGLIELYLKEQPQVRKDLVAALTKDPALLFKDFIKVNLAAQTKLKEFQKANKDPREKTLMTEFLKKRPQMAQQLTQFIKSGDLTANVTLFKAFINKDVVRRQNFVEFAKKDPETIKAFTEHKKKHPQSTVEEYIKNNLFQNTKLNKKFLAASKEHQKDFEEFLKEDEAVIREFVSANKSAQRELNSFINSNQKAKLQYEMFVKQNPTTQLTFEEFLGEHPEAMDHDPRDDVYAAFLSENPEMMAAFITQVKNNPNQSLTAKEFVQSNDTANHQFSAFATEDVLNEIQNIEEFSHNFKEINDHIPSFVEQNEKIVIDIINRDPQLRKALEEARMKNPSLSLSKLMLQNQAFSKAVTEKIKEDKASMRQIIKSHSGLKDKYVTFVENKQRQQADFEQFVKNNAQVKQIFQNMQKENSNLTMDDFVKEAKKNDNIRELYVRETLYNPDNNQTYQQFLKTNIEVSRAYEQFQKDPKNQGVGMDEYIQTIKDDLGMIEKYKNQMTKDPSIKNYIRDYIDSDSEVRNKFNKFVKDKVDVDDNYEKFVKANKTILQSYETYKKTNAGKGSYRDFVNKNPNVHFQFINFIKDHPETLEEFINHDQKINQGYRNFHMKTKDEAHFDEFLRQSSDVNREYEATRVKNPKVTFEDFARDFKQTDKARKMFDSHQKMNTTEAINDVIKNKEQRNQHSPKMGTKFEFKDSLLDYSKSKVASPNKDINHIRVVADHDDSIGSNALNSPLTGLGGDDNTSEQNQVVGKRLKDDRHNTSERSKR